MSNEMPSNIAIIRDTAIDHAYGRSPLPANIDELYNWLVYESDDEALDNYKFYFSLDEINLSDEALFESIDESDGEPISDAMRVSFAREQIIEHVEGVNEDLRAAHAFKLTNEKGETTFACCIIVIQGQYGPHADWDGFFASREAYYDYQKNTLEQYDAGQVDQITDAEILSVWDRR